MQVIGFVFLLLLGILLILLLFLLFYPICYKIEGKFYNQQIVKANVSWLFHFLRATLLYEETMLSATVFIFWKKFSFSHAFLWKKEESKIDVDLESEIDSHMDNIAKENAKTQKASRKENHEDTKEPENPASETSAKKKSKFEVETETKEQKEETSDQNNEIPQKERNGFFEKIKGMISKIKGMISKIKQVWSRLKRVITEESNKAAIKHIKKELLLLGKSFVPIKSEVNGTFSAGSPDITGQIVGILSIFPVPYQKNWYIKPDFTAEEAYFEGKFYAKGRIYVYQIVFRIVSIVFDKNCRRLYRMIKYLVKTI